MARQCSLKANFQDVTLKSAIFTDEKFASILLSEIDLLLIGGLHFTDFI